MKKQTKFTIILAVLIFFISGTTIGIHMISSDSDKPDTSRQSATNPDTPSIRIDADGIREHADMWDSFVQTSQNGKSTSIQLDYDYPGQLPHGNGTPAAAPDTINLEFNGEHYLCFGKTYKYLLELTDRADRAAKNTTYVILSNEPYSFRDIHDSIYSSSLDDRASYMQLFTR